MQDLPEEKIQKPKISRKAIASVLLPLAGLIIVLHDIYSTGFDSCGGLALFALFFPLVGVGLGLEALHFIRKTPKKLKGIVLAWTGILSPMIFFIALIVIVPQLPPTGRPFHEFARSMGRNAKLAEEVFFNQFPEGQGHYTTSLDDLLSVDKDLTDDPGITFVFLHANQSEFAFYTTHTYDRKKRNNKFYSLNNSPFKKAIVDGRMDDVKKMIDQGVDLDAGHDHLKDWGPSPLLVALRYNQLEIAKILIEKGAEVNRDFFDWHERTPLHEAAHNGQKDLVALLILHGAKVEALNEYGRTPLHLAANTGQLEVVKYLIAKGSKVNAKDYTHRTALSYAVEKGKAEMAAFLISRGGRIE